MKIYSRFDVPDSNSVEFGVSMTQQHFKDECDINNIIRSYRASEPAPPAFFGDCTVTELADAYALSESVQERFDSLSSDIRQKFNNNPLELIQFVSNVDNQTAAVELGLIEAPVPPVSVETVEAPVPPRESIVEQSVTE